jgi:hypothetical protein
MLGKTVSSSELYPQPLFIYFNGYINNCIYLKGIVRYFNTYTMCNDQVGISVTSGVYHFFALEHSRSYTRYFEILCWKLRCSLMVVCLPCTKPRV